ncbi:MAG TPA: phenylalanine--tRNA ligase subunit alpha [Candidatus Aerophobetes bacterium]|uniref:Phenylalanine--tRNA ligase alpha subunit n=1 Tax=Aerophobetes bacterium TaxID=2030807 RepID=A0A7V0MYY5_UNCAE|nr:phenylalanine--tRNA ligase subunit alpha [Candidatus Aerophobetes bacterium]
MEKIKNLETNLGKRINSARTKEEIEKIRIELLGRKRGEITLLLKKIPELPLKDRPRVGNLLNKLKKEAEQLLQKKEESFKKGEKVLKKIDITLPGKIPLIGKVHPINQVLNEIKDIFIGLGFEVVVGPEIETEYYNFEALNMPKYHPARDEQDSFYIDSTHLLRTQTSPVQIRVMEKSQPPIRMISPGLCYRRDAIDASHFPVFHQVEGLAVDKNITFADLKGTLTYFVHQMFGKNTRLRFRPSYFPFTEPSAEVDISCIICGGSGCSVCSNKGWLEILGSGMVDPEVFKKVGYDPEKYQGFAFGMGVERICMLKYGIDDIRLFFQNDLRFLSQF